MAILTGVRPLFHFSMAPLAGLVRELLAKPLNLAAICLDMTLGAVLRSIHVSFVVEFHPSFELHDICRKGGTRKNCKKSNGYHDFFHLASPGT